MRPVAAILIALLLASCSQRERNNPFDPGNPDTGGRPSGFAAIAEFQAVHLRWNAASPSSEVLGFSLERRLAGATTWVPISGLLAPSATQFLDLGLPNGTTFEYRLFYEFPSGPGVLPALDLATPGALQAWVADFSGTRLVRVSADGREIAASFTLAAGAQLSDVEVEVASGEIWACAPYQARVFVLRPATGQVTTLQGLFETPVSLALDPVDGSAWVGDDGFDRVYHIDGNGQLLTPNWIDLVRGPLGMATDRDNRSLWVCERDGGTVRHFDNLGAPIAATPMGAPSRVAVDSLTGEAWVTSFSGSELRRLSPTGVEIDRFGVDGPIGVAVDWRRRRVWVAEARAGQLLALHVDGTVERTIVTGGEPSEVAVDLASGDAWVIVRDQRQLRRYTATGDELARVAGFADPIALALDPGPRPAQAPDYLTNTTRAERVPPAPIRRTK